MRRILRVVVVVVCLCGLAGCAGSIQDQMGPQSFEEPSVGPVGCEDAEILEAVRAAVTVAKLHGLRYDASGSETGLVVVNALWKERPVTLTMRFFRKEGGLYIATSAKQSGYVFVKGGGDKIEELFYADLNVETTRRGLTVYADTKAAP